MTEYIILRETKSGGEDIAAEYVIVAMLKMRSARAAIGKYVNGSKEEGDFVAVPSRSFRTVSVKVETKTSLKFS